METVGAGLRPGTGVGHMPGLDGLRGLLVPVVLTYHLGIAGFGGFLALEGFFVLSGFLITLLLLNRPPSGPGDLGRWWLRRWRRLIPAVVVVVTTTLVVFRSTPGIVHSSVSTLTWWRNWDMAFGATTYWSTVPSPLKHAWSLSVEEQFYLVFPLLVMGVLWLARRRRWRPAPVVAAVCGVGAALSYGWQAWLATTTSDLNRVYLGSDTRAGSILLGCTGGAVVAHLGTRERPASRWLTVAAFGGLAAIVALGFVLQIEGRSTYRGGFAASSLAWLVVTTAAARPGVVARGFTLRPLRWMGVRSYGIYLWSWPVQVFVQGHWPRVRLGELAAIVVVVAFGLGDLSLRLVERPLRTASGWAATPRRRRVAWSGGIAAAVAAAVVVALTAPPSDPLLTMTEQSTSADAMNSVGKLAASAPATTTVAPSGAPTTTVAGPAVVPTTAVAPTAKPHRLVVLVGGDSQAATAANDVKRSELPDYIAAVANAGVLGCGVLVRTPGWMVDNPARGGLVDGSYCRGKGSAEAAEIIGLSAHPDWLVITSGGYEQSHAYQMPDGQMVPPDSPEIRQGVKDALGLRIARANAQGTRVALLEFACPGRKRGEPGWDEFTRASIEWHNSNLREIAAAHPGTITIAPSDRVCVNGDAAGQPTPEKAKAWGTADRVHVTDRGQGWVWKVQIGPALWAATLRGVGVGTG